jgi:glycine hydroxymethyltransferase
MITSGIRLGTPALTTRGMKEPEFELIAELINKIVMNPADEKVKADVREEVKKLTSRFTMYGTR